MMGKNLSFRRLKEYETRLYSIVLSAFIFFQYNLRNYVTPDKPSLNVTHSIFASFISHILWSLTRVLVILTKKLKGSVLNKRGELRAPGYRYRGNWRVRVPQIRSGIFKMNLKHFTHPRTLAALYTKNTLHVLYNSFNWELFVSRISLFFFNGRAIIKHRMREKGRKHYTFIIFFIKRHSKRSTLSSAMDAIYGNHQSYTIIK